MSLNLATLKDLPKTQDLLDLNAIFELYSRDTHEKADMILSIKVQTFSKSLGLWLADRALVLTSKELVIFRVSPSGGLVTKRRLDLSSWAGIGSHSKESEILAIYSSVTKSKALVLKSER